MKQTIADCMDGIEPEDITDMVVESGQRRLLYSDYAVRLLHLRSETKQNNNNRKLEDDSIITSYIIRSSDPALTYETLTSQLTAAVSSGTFDSLLTTNAENAGATELVGCETSDITTENVDMSDESSDKGLSAGAIAGIVIGVIVGVSLIIAVVYCFYKEKKVIPTTYQA